MSTNTTLTVRLDGGLKRQAETICKEMGLNMSSAITIFLKRLVKERAIPFRVSADDHFIVRKILIICELRQLVWMQMKFKENRLEILQCREHYSG